jgi:hypothetical protein
MGFKGTLHGVEVELSGTIEVRYFNFNFNSEQRMDDVV